jgi:hypothetical protein
MHGIACNGAAFAHMAALPEHAAVSSGLDIERLRPAAASVRSAKQIAGWRSGKMLKHNDQLDADRRVRLARDLTLPATSSASGKRGRRRACPWSRPSGNVRQAARPRTFIG